MQLIYTITKYGIFSDLAKNLKNDNVSSLLVTQVLNKNISSTRRQDGEIALPKITATIVFDRM